MITIINSIEEAKYIIKHHSKIYSLGDITKKSKLYKVNSYQKKTLFYGYQGDKYGYVELQARGRDTTGSNYLEYLVNLMVVDEQGLKKFWEMVGENYATKDDFLQFCEFINTEDTKDLPYSHRNIKNYYMQCLINQIHYIPLLEREKVFYKLDVYNGQILYVQECTYQGELRYSDYQPEGGVSYVCYRLDDDQQNQAFKEATYKDFGGTLVTFDKKIALKLTAISSSKYSKEPVKIKVESLLK